MGEKEQKDIEAREPVESLEVERKALAEKEEELVQKEKFLTDLQDYLDKREQELADAEKALAKKGPSVALATTEKKPITKEEQKLIDEGCKAYGIDKKHLFASGIDRTGDKPVAVLLTNGGTRVRFAKGDKVEELDPVQVDGISRKKPRHVAGKKK
jgi:hypothetical protein